MLLLKSSPAHGPGRRAASRLFNHVLAAVALAGAALSAPACGGGDGGSGGSGGSATDCVGGVIVDGVCEGKCSPDKCAFEQNTCVDNRCRLICDSHKDCYTDGSQNCTPGKEDDTDADVTVCQFTGKPAGQGTSCPFGTECGNWLACPDGAACFASQCGGDPAACVLDQDACGDTENCTIGKCTGDSAPCRVNCQTECGAWLDCQTKGEADADAYCTKRDCESDADCLGGYYCGIIRDPHEICGSDPQKGDNNFCGQTSEPCQEPGMDGKSTFEGSLCMLRKSCLKRDQSVPCETNLDCSQIDGQLCADLAGEKRCARACANDNDCTPDYGCNAGACLPRFGAWVGGGGGFCEPCVSDEDCGKNGTTWACAELSGGMRACFDEAFPDTCTTDADCPTSPSGKHGTCFDEDFGFAPGDSLYHRCYLPISLSDNKTSCW